MEKERKQQQETVKQDVVQHGAELRREQQGAEEEIAAAGCRGERERDGTG